MSCNADPSTGCYFRCKKDHVDISAVCNIAYSMMAVNECLKMCFASPSCISADYRESTGYCYLNAAGCIVNPHPEYDLYKVVCLDERGTL